MYTERERERERERESRHRVSHSAASPLAARGLHRPRGGGSLGRPICSTYFNLQIIIIVLCTIAEL